MKEIANLARIVTSRKLTVPPLIDFEEAELSKNKEVQLVNALVADPTLSTLQGIKTIYGENTPAAQQALRKLVSRVQTKLLNQLYFFDHSDERHPVSRRFEMECLDLLHKASVLYAEGEYVMTEQLLRRCLRVAKAGDFTLYAMQATQVLRKVYSDQGNTVRYDAMASQLLKLQQLLALEQEGDRLYANARQAMARTVATRQAIMPQLPGYIAQLEAIYLRAKTFDTFNYLYQLRLAYEELRGNFEGIITIALNAAKRVEKGKVNERRFDRRLNQFVMIYAHLQSRQALEGLKLADVYARNFHPTSGNWLYFHEHHWLLAMHAGEYERARHLLVVAKESSAFSKQREVAKQRWDLFEAYLDFVQPPPRPTPAQRRRQEQWLLALPEHTRDKRGYNVAIIILQVLYFLRQRDLDKLLVHLDGLRKYQQRYLRDPAVLRTQLFMRLLPLIVEKNFDPAAVEIRAQVYLKKLRAAPMPGGAFAEIEIVPYERLWEKVVQILRESWLLGVMPAPTPQHK